MGFASVRTRSEATFATGIAAILCARLFLLQPVAKQVADREINKEKCSVQKLLPLAQNRGVGLSLRRILSMKFRLHLTCGNWASGPQAMSIFFSHTNNQTSEKTRSAFWCVVKAEYHLSIIHNFTGAGEYNTNKRHAH